MLEDLSIEAFQALALIFEKVNAPEFHEMTNSALKQDQLKDLPRDRLCYVEEADDLEGLRDKMSENWLEFLTSIILD